MRKRLVDREHPQLSIRRQCQLLEVNRNRLVEKPRVLPQERLDLRRAIDEFFLAQPTYGARRIVKVLRRHGFEVSRNRVRREMRAMGLRPIYPRPRTSIQALENPVYPYLLRDQVITRPDQVWCTDITYIPMRRGFAYLIAIMDWASRAVLSWEVSNTLDTSFCLRALEKAFGSTGTTPEIFNTDQGCQFTGKDWTDALREKGVRISMDGKGRWMDNVFIERLWRSVKYEDVYLREYGDLDELRSGLELWFAHYNESRPHAALGDQTPWEVYRPRGLVEAA